MQIMDIIKMRRSVRKFASAQVEDDTIRKVLEAARLAPSWRNQQCWKFVVVNQSEMIKKVVEHTGIYNRAWLGKAPVLIIACGDPAASGSGNGQPYYMVDVAIATEHLVLAATELGLGTCWIGAFDADEIKSMLEIPNHIEIVTIIPLGYPHRKDSLAGKMAKAVVRSHTRKPIDEIFFYNKWK
ncbi:nitroreductase [candidate division KSB1 bacterium]|nr:nitroreductase [candidate division KSB1 bacterium]